MTSLLRKAGSLIIARKVLDPIANNSFDYKILFLKRASKLRWAEVLAYPGGLIEEDDYKFVKRQPERFPGIEDPDKLLYHVSKIAALRETYEETGLFFLQDKLLRTDTLETIKNLVQQGKEIGQLPNFFDCANMLDMQYDHGIKEVLRLVTVPHIPNRYNCQFFLTIAEEEKTLNLSKAEEDFDYLQNLDELRINEAESIDYKWLNPFELLHATLNKTIKLAPPQFMIANIMLSFPKINDFMCYLSKIRGRNENNDYMKDLFEKNPLTYPLMIGMAKHNNKEMLERGYKFAGLFPCDKDYPVDMYLSAEKDEEWKREMVAKYMNIHSENRGTCRIYFKDPKEMFDNDFSFDIKVGVDFPYQKMVGLDELQKTLIKLSL